MKSRQTILHKIEKPKASTVRNSQFINNTNEKRLSTTTCRCPCKDEVMNLADGIARLEKLASVQSKLINKIARQIHLDSDAEEEYEVSPVHSNNLSITFPITTAEGLLDLDDVLQDKSVHEHVVSVSFLYINI